MQTIETARTLLAKESPELRRDDKIGYEEPFVSGVVQTQSELESALTRAEAAYGKLIESKGESQYDP